MTWMGGLFELVLALSVLLAWWFVELRLKRLDRAKAETKADADQTEGRSS